MLSRLIYVSTRTSSCTDDEINKILKVSNTKNEVGEFTGMLLYSGRKFLQVLEGESEKVLALYDKIKLDKRHKLPMMVSLMPIKKRDFPNWHMGSKKIGDNAIEFKSEISMKDKSIVNDIISGKEHSDAMRVIRRVFLNQDIAQAQGV